jgi:hypothetical protein
MSDFYPISPTKIKQELIDVNFDWWICGGWALELYSGKKIREHHDMDIAILRKDQFKLKEQLPGWEFKIAVDGILYDWGDHEIDKNLHALWAKKVGEEKWITEFLLNEASDKDWIFRKDPEITYPLNAIGLIIDTIPVLKPMIPLLFKSGHCNEKDDLDFFAVIDLMDADQKQTLKEWIKKFKPECRWLREF